MTVLAHKIRLYPNKKQATLLSKSCGTARFSYNWALSEWKRQYESCEKPNDVKIRRELNAIKHEEFPWMQEVSKCCVQEAIINLGTAFKRFFNNQSKYPVFKKKFINDSFTLSSGNFEVKQKHIRLAKIGNVRLGEKFRFESIRLISITISREADQWYVSIQCEINDVQKLPKTNKTTGIDRGVREYVDSDGNFYEVPRSFRCKERKLRRLQQSLSRKQKGSKNRVKAKLKVAKCYKKIKDIRNDWLHKLTTKIVRENDVICVEDLNVKGMVKNKRLAKSILDAAFGEFSRQLIYKCRWYGRTLVIADRWFPSSKICSSCSVKTKQKLGLHVREWTCENCGTKHHRDINAAINLDNYAGSLSVSACGEFLPLALQDLSCKVKVPRKTRNRKKQESNTILTTSDFDKF